MWKRKPEFACGLGLGTAFVNRPKKMQPMCFGERVETDKI